MPESMVHLLARTFLFQLLQHALGPEHAVGSEQFVYWVATNPRRTLAPDVFVKLGVAQTLFKTWKCWLRGAPDLAVEVVSDSDEDPLGWDEKLARYAEMGVAEVVRFDPEARAGERLRVWDRMEEDLVERAVAGDTSPCATLGWTWVVRPIDGAPVGLRLEAADGTLVPSATEAARARTAELEAELAELRRERDRAK
jgi:Uma2 family endonuclease